MATRILSWRAMVVGLGLGVAALAAVGVAADFQVLAWHLEQFPKVTLLLALALTLTNYLLRMMRWHWLVNRLGAGKVSWGESSLIFISGLSMVVTPGKVGELLKSYLLRVICGVPVPRSAPVVFAERLYDGLAMVLLSLVGLFSFKTAWVPAFGFTAFAIILVIVLSSPQALTSILRTAKKFPILRNRWEDLATVLDSSHRLTRFGVLVPAVVAGVASWFGECVAFYVILLGLGLPAGTDTLLLATFVLAISTLVGSLSLLPGGVGAAELTIYGLLVGVGALDLNVAGAATIIVRLVTLWFGTAVGFIGLAITALVLRATQQETSTVFHK